MADQPTYAIGDRVEVLLDPSRWRTSGWMSGTVIRIDGYSAHRSFYWIELDTPAEAFQGARLSVVSVINPSRIRGA
jgi:hypothetical protein